MKEDKLRELAGIAVRMLVDDVTSRGGLDATWEGIDDETRDEIRASWEEIVLRAFRALLSVR